MVAKCLIISIQNEQIQSVPQTQKYKCAESSMLDSTFWIFTIVICLAWK